MSEEELPHERILKEQSTQVGEPESSPEGEAESLDEPKEKQEYGDYDFDDVFYDPMSNVQPDMESDSNEEWDLDG